MKLGETIGDLMRAMMFRIGGFCFYLPYIFCYLPYIWFVSELVGRTPYFSWGGVSGSSYRGFEEK